MEQNAWVVAVLTTRAGDPDMYIWEPFNGFQPDHFVNNSVAPGQTESAGGKLSMPTGRALLEVLAVGSSEYTLSFAQDGEALPIIAAQATAKLRPQHPLTVSDPLSAGVVEAPGEAPTSTVYLPWLFAKP